MSEDLEKKIDEAYNDTKDTFEHLNSQDIETDPSNKVLNSYNEGRNISNNGNGNIYVNTVDIDDLKTIISSLEKDREDARSYIANQDKNIEIIKNNLYSKDEIIKVKNEEIGLLKAEIKELRSRLNKFEN